MAAPKGNQFWKARTKHGRDKLFASAEVLWAACCEYFQWVEKNPLWESKPFHHQGEIVTATVPKMRAMTLDGLCIFLDIDPTTWRDWRSAEDFSPIVTRVESIIRDQKFSGAAADLLNASIIARDLGLKDANSHEHTGANGGPIETVTRVELVADTGDDH
ncbi:DNA-packaging protein [Halomonas salifodinae]|uniref:DNA-packaging protein n=1 Tax=Halomonas salifodinae TaxID=438745 RepID=A0ABW2F1F1_9GAMM